MIDRINRYAAEHFGGLGTTRSSLIRIHVWALAFLVLVSSVASTHDLAGEVRARLGPVQVLNRDHSDQRAFGSSAFGKRAFHIAWIFSSEGYVARATAGIPSLVAFDLEKSLPNIGGRKVVVDIYGFLGMGLGDLHLALLDALAAKPDLVLLSLNPLQVMNPGAVHRWPQLDARGAVEIAKRPGEWPLGAALFSPSDLLWGLTESQLTPVRERSYWSTRVHDLVDDLGPLDRSQVAVSSSARAPDRAQAILGSEPVTFWLTHRFNVFREDRFALLGVKQWTDWFNVSNRGDNQLNAVMLRAIGAELRATKIPSIVYLAQVNSAWLATSPPFSRAVRRVERQLRSATGAFDARNVRYQPETLSRFVSGLAFIDGVHVTDTGTVGPYLASQVCQLLTRIGQGARCRPRQGGSKDG